MDIIESETLRISRNCEEISAYNFFKLKSTKDLQWLYPKYDGWESVKDRLPDDAEEVSYDIFDEYSKLTKNNTTLLYMECVDDLEILATRIYGASILLDNIDRRWGLMDKDIRKQYVETLKGWNFILNLRKPFKDEMKRLHRQLRAAKTKFKRLEKDRKDLEEKFKNKNSDIIELVVHVKNILKRDLDLKKMSIKEWHYTLESLPRKKAS